ncbi:MAG: hypothetical protein A2Z29_04025 [Chloroflexi bacterium RBG_16_56_11]|nr:MAG: hypothetical protein A2Z29_04025 [Chloroflexi bacterium RBG_16_56_11]
MPGKNTNAIRRPESDEIQDVAHDITDIDFWQCVRFADVLIRYLEITMKTDGINSRLQGTALYFLLIKGGRSTPTQLARLMLRSKHSITKIIDDLEKEGLVVRDSTSRDRRVTSVELTSAGLDQVKKRFLKGNERARKIMACLDASEQKLLAKMMERMRKKMTSALESH